MDNLFTVLSQSIANFVGSESVNGLAALISTGIFLIVFLLISFHVLHETAAALIGAVVVFLITYIGGTYDQRLKILTFSYNFV